MRITLLSDPDRLKNSSVPQLIQDFLFLEMSRRAMVVGLDTADEVWSPRNHFLEKVHQ